MFLAVLFILCCFLVIIIPNLGIIIYTKKLLRSVSVSLEINMEFIELILVNKLDGVILKYPHHETVDGTVCITGHHLILSSRKEGVRELWVSKNVMNRLRCQVESFGT